MSFSSRLIEGLSTIRDTAVADYEKSRAQTPVSKREYNPAQWNSIFPFESAERNLLAHNKEWVFIATDKVSRAVASVRYKVMRYQNSGDDREIFDGPLVNFLDSPSAQYTGKDFIYLSTAWKELTGNSFWEVLKNKKIAPLLPLNIQPRIAGGQLVGFKYSDGTGTRDLTLDQVLHDRYLDPRKPHWGVGKLEKIARWVDTSSYANEFIKLFFVNGAQFGGFITTEEETEERIKLIKLGLVNDHVGVQNAHKIGVLPKGSEFQEASSNMQDMQFTQLDEQYRDKILSGFGVPKTLVGFTTDVNRASAEASEYIFAKYTVKPIVDDFLEFLNHDVAPLFDSTGKYYFACDEFIPENTDYTLNERKLALNSQPYKTVNEVRAEIGMPPIKGGDVIYGNPFQVPLGSPPPDPIVPADDPQADPQDKPDDEPKKSVPRRARAGIALERMVGTIARKASEIAEKHRDSDAESHKAFVARVLSYRERLTLLVRDFNGKQKNAVMLRLHQLTKAVSKTDLFDMETEVGVLIDIAGPLLKTLMTEQAMEEYKAQGFDGAFSTDASSIKRIVEFAAKRFAKSYNNTTATLLKQALNEGIQAGEGFDDLSKRVQKVYEFSDAYRAEQVAHTETFYIANEGSREAYKQSGVVKTLRWYTGEDELVCEFCAPEDGRVVGIDDDFHSKGTSITGRDGGTLNLDYRTIDVPPLHPNCRCFIRPDEISVQ